MENFWGDPFGFRPAPTAPAWEASPADRSPWDLVTFDGDPGKSITGIWRVTTKLHHRIDYKKKPGVPGATATFMGPDPVEVDATVQMWTREHLEQYRRLTSFFRGLVGAALAAAPGSPTSRRLAFEIYHPALELLGVDKVIVVDIGAPRSSAIAGVLEATFKFSEFTPPSSDRPATATGSHGDVPVQENLSYQSTRGATPPHQDPKQSAP